MHVRLTDAVFALPQYVIPHHPLSRLMGLLTHSGNRLWKTLFIKWFVRRYRVDMNEAEQDDLSAYTSFNHFFTRALKGDLRLMPEDPTVIVSPADGVVSQFGTITGDEIIQAKGRTYGVTALLGGNAQQAEAFRGGRFATIYLSPRDYHRLHMPVAGRLTAMVHVPGRLFSVNAATTAVIPNLFARNERVIAFFETEAGPMALVLVGALFVASIETVWHGVVTPPTVQRVQTWRYQDNAPTLLRGDEMGRFNMGSTIVVLFGEHSIEWGDHLAPGAAIKMGQSIGVMNVTS